MFAVKQSTTLHCNLFYKCLYCRHGVFIPQTLNQNGKIAVTSWFKSLCGCWARGPSAARLASHRPELVIHSCILAHVQLVVAEAPRQFYCSTPPAFYRLKMKKACQVLLPKPRSANSPVLLDATLLMLRSKL